MSIWRVSMSDIFIKSTNFMPNDYQKSIFDINFATLKEKGIIGLLIDVDNTLIPYDESTPSQKLIDLFVYLKEIGFQIMIISNNKVPRIQTFSAILNCQFIAKAKKPFSFSFKKAMRTLNIVDKKSVCVIGDQLMTDVFGAKRLGLMCILVDAINLDNEKWFTKLNRKLEKRVLNRIEKKYPSYFNDLKLGEKR